MSLKENWDVKVLHGENLFQIYCTPSPYDSLNHKNRKIGNRPAGGQMRVRTIQIYDPTA